MLPTKVSKSSIIKHYESKLEKAHKHHIFITRQSYECQQTKVGIASKHHAQVTGVFRL